MQLRHPFLEQCEFFSVSDYTNLVDWTYDKKRDAENFLTLNDNEASVCAVVRVRISQRAVLTREAFQANLEVDTTQTQGNIYLVVNEYNGLIVVLLHVLPII